MTVIPPIGSLVRLVAVPPGLRDDDDLRSLSLFTACLGRSFAVIGVVHGRVELHVGEVVGAPAFRHSIYVEPEFIEAAET